MISTGLNKHTVPQLNGLVLAGGKSVRMGQDKGSTSWHGKEQRYHMADLLTTFCENIFISCRPEQQPEISSDYETLPDTVIEAGPYGAILSAFEQRQDVAWLVIACDLPLMDKDTIAYLIANRNSETLATTFESPHDGLPEPLITIWEPQSYAVLRSFRQEGYSCPRKVLINSAPTILKPQNPAALMNVNTPEDAILTREILHKRTVV